MVKGVTWGHLRNFRLLRTWSTALWMSRPVGFVYGTPDCLDI